MHIFQNIKTYDKPRNKDRLNEQKEPKKEPDSWFDAFKGCLFAIFLFEESSGQVLDLFITRYYEE